MASAGYRQIEHTADLALALWAPSEVDLLRQALRAVVSILTDEASIEAKDSRLVELEALDPEDRLVRWINELLYLASVEGFVPSDADIELVDAGLRATVRGEADARSRLVTEIKSATYHDLQLRHDGEQVVAQVVMDV